MLKARERSLILFFLLSDLFLLNLSLSIVGYLKYVNIWQLKDSFYLLNICWFITYLFFINEELFKKKSLFKRIFSLGKKFGIYIAITSILIILFDLDDLSRTMFFGSILLFFGLKFFMSFFYSYLISKRKKGQYYSTVLIIGVGDAADQVYNYYKKNPDIGHVIGYLSDESPKNSRLNIIGRISEFKNLVKNTYLNEIIVTLHLNEHKKIAEIIHVAEKYGIRPRVVPNYHRLFNRSAEIQTLGKIPIINIREVPVERYNNRFWKRAFDIVFASAALLFTAPFFLVIAVAIKFESKGPVFFKPTRCGRRSSSFVLYKFRSMRENDDAKNGSKSTILNDIRITRVGKFIRKTNLDELPQFINVLLNQMSVVGPRPHRVNLNQTFQKKVSTYMVRQYIKPGITGWAQVNGWRGPTETRIQYFGRALHDLWYIEHWTFGLDIYIIFLTLFGTKTRKNAF